MPKKNMLDKDVERTHKNRGRAARTDPDYPEKKKAHETAQDRRGVVRASRTTASNAQLRSGRWG